MAKVDSSKFVLLDEYKECGYGFGEKTYYNAWHLGRDLLTKIGDKVKAPWGGVLLGVSYGEEGGYWAYFLDDLGYLHRYGHLDKSTKTITTGRKERGEEIAIAGNTGKYTSGPHVHWDAIPNCQGWSTLDIAISNHAKKRALASTKQGLFENFTNPDHYIELVVSLVDSINDEPSEWAKDDVEFVKSLGIMGVQYEGENFVTMDEFRPNEGVTRQEVAVMIARTIRYLIKYITKIKND